MAVKRKRRLKAFVCYSSNDRSKVQAACDTLKLVQGLNLWIDYESLVPGHHWEHEIVSAVQSSDVVIVFLSNNAVSRSGFLHKEVSIAIDIAELQPEGEIFIIPVRLDKCAVPERLSHLHYVDLYEGKGVEKLIQSLTIRAQSLRIVLNSTPQMSLIQLINIFRASLHRKDFQHADQATAVICLSAAGRLEEGWLDARSMRSFPCDLLRILDAAWLQASGGHFGFSVQAEIWRSLGGTPEAARESLQNFAQEVGWSRKGTTEWSRWGELEFHINAPRGHLPTPPRWWELWDGFRQGEHLLFYRIDSCINERETINVKPEPPQG